jgi:hypothetical protein
MPTIIVRGGNKNLKRICNEAIDFYITDLLRKRKRLLNHITIELIIKPKPVDRAGTKAWAWVEDSNTKPRSFIIETSSKDVYGKYVRLGAMLENLAHECVHIKQWATGQMQERDTPQHTVWWEDYETEETHDDGYWELPWELDAYGRERGLYYRFCQEYNYTKEQWFDERGRNKPDY